MLTRAVWACRRLATLKLLTKPLSSHNHNNPIHAHRGSVGPQAVMLLLQNAAQPRVAEAAAQLRTHLKLFDYSSLPAPPAFQVCLGIPDLHQNMVPVACFVQAVSCRTHSTGGVPGECRMVVWPSMCCWPASSAAANLMLVPM